MSVPFTLRPWPKDERKPKNLAEFIARVQAERGGFRNVTESGLRAEIAGRRDGDGGSEDGDAEMADADDESRDKNGGAAADEKEAKDAVAARINILKNIDVAHNTAMLSLEFVSLLLSKETPVQAGITLSQQLRDMVGIGTLGSTLYRDAEITEEKSRESHETAAGWTLMGIEGMRDAAARATDLLRREIALEATYWEDVLDISEKGWSICRLPQAGHLLGVRYGFLEAPPDFSNNSLAPLRRDDTGHAELELGRTGGGRRRIAVSLERDGKVVGRTMTGAVASTSPGANADQAPTLQSRVLEARNTIFSQEMWHELHRESHALASYGVGAENQSLTMETGRRPGEKLRLELVSLDDEPAATPGGGDSGQEEGEEEENLFTATIHLCLHVLLSHAHRQHEQNRQRALPPHLSRSRAAAAAATTTNSSETRLFRPLIARLLHHREVHACARRVGDLVAVLRRAGVPGPPAFSLATPPLPPPPSSSSGNGNGATGGPAAGLVNGLLSSLEFRVELTLTPECRLAVRAKTWTAPQVVTQYRIHLLPSYSSSSAPASNDTGKSSTVNNALAEICPPYAAGYPDLREATMYLNRAAVRALTRFFFTYVRQLQARRDAAKPPKRKHGRPAPGPDQAAADAAGSDSETDSAVADTVTWQENLRGNSIRDAESEMFKATFDMVDDNEDGTDGRPVLNVQVAWPAIRDAPAREETWTWRPDGKGTGDVAGKKIHLLIRELVAASWEAS